MYLARDRTQPRVFCVRINTVQTALLQQWRKLNQQQEAGQLSRPEAGSTGMGASFRMRRLLQRAVARTRQACAALNAWLGSYYQVCQRTGFDLPPSESRIIRLRPNEVVRVTRASRASRLEVRCGTVWLTGTPARGDVLLCSGDCFVLKENGPFVVEAIGSAQIVLVS